MQSNQGNQKVEQNGSGGHYYAENYLKGKEWQMVKMVKSRLAYFLVSKLMPALSFAVSVSKQAAAQSKGVLSSVIERDPAAVRVSIKHHYLSCTGSVGIDDRLGVSALIHAGADGARHKPLSCHCWTEFHSPSLAFFFFLSSEFWTHPVFSKHNG